MIHAFVSAILDLAKLLAEHKDRLNNPLDMPRRLILQFDNCPENKVHKVYESTGVYFVHH